MDLTLQELTQIAITLAKLPQSQVDPEIVLNQLDVSDASFRLRDPPQSLWLSIVKSIHAGLSERAGYGRDAVAELIGVVAAMLPGNNDLNSLAFGLGRIFQRQHQATSRLFLSYARADYLYVDPLFDALNRKGDGTEVFQDHRSLRPGQKWLDVLREKAGTASIMACWLTRSYLASSFCHYEVGIADSKGCSIVPILADAESSRMAPSYLSERQALRVADFCSLDALAERILSVVKR